MNSRNFWISGYESSEKRIAVIVRMKKVMRSSAGYVPRSRTAEYLCNYKDLHDLLRSALHQMTFPTRKDAVTERIKAWVCSDHISPFHPLRRSGFHFRRYRPGFSPFWKWQTLLLVSGFSLDALLPAILSFRLSFYVRLTSPSPPSWTLTIPYRSAHLLDGPVHLTYPHFANIERRHHYTSAILHIANIVEGRGGVVARLFASHQGEPGPIPCGVAPGFSRVGIVPDDAAGLRVLSRISRFPRPFIAAPLHTHLAAPSSALNTPMLRSAQIFPSICVTFVKRYFYIILAILAQRSRNFASSFKHNLNFIRLFHEVSLLEDHALLHAPGDFRPITNPVEKIRMLPMWDRRRMIVCRYVSMHAQLESNLRIEPEISRGWIGAQALFPFNSILVSTVVEDKQYLIGIYHAQKGGIGHCGLHFQRDHVNHDMCTRRTIIHCYLRAYLTHDPFPGRGGWLCYALCAKVGKGVCSLYTYARGSARSDVARAWPGSGKHARKYDQG
ncbi:hypothetical protein PR048_001877 [Dryococelus australis]|uniref:Maturase K n=1 Tax=Dryococelus australis TaxID=614101 RepID=A0ABQ9IIK9_9NEOP|nr:hypothetical protein PR048_001877 [Dryococelus australis]